ncbi:squamous cell carcinoma antigen recognized by T-cells 3-like [Artemia franciscana]|uniref:RRM domain-containing protein n=1 Tax=Artemia franciscana TaxID=6661 RepID=A0AA88IA16_ARTSF|nr:hypothetical protein QYM36_001791 [Artemia franciscana]KAK2723234.1 hypothetical protein QYM36_001791 [Artemia franciscana]
MYENNGDVPMKDDAVQTNDKEDASDLTDEHDTNKTESSHESLDEENRKAKERELVSLEKQLAGNIYSYDLHLSRVKLLKELGELDRLRLAYKEMSNLFPLSEDLWLDWIQDESKIAVSEEEKNNVCELFETAIKDYLSVPIWLEYCQFTIGGGDIEESRAVFERAIQAAGLHVSNGAILWEAFREYEICILQTIISAGGEEDTIVNQKERVEKLFKRQLSCPLLNNDSSFSEYESWKSENNEPVDQSVVENYQKANEVLQKLTPFEEELLVKDDKSDVYRNYIKYEVEKDEPARILCLCERAVADCPLVGDLWMIYINYVTKKLKDLDLSVVVHKKSLRNCPWIGELWSSYILLLEKIGKDKQEVLKAVEKALSIGLSSGIDYKKVWFAYIDYIRRQAKLNSEKDLDELRSILGRATENVLSNFGLEGDPSCDFYIYWARLEFSVGSLEEARKLWSEALELGLSKSAVMWLKYISLEQKYGDSKHVRRLFQRALQADTDWPEGIVNEWIMYERERGSLDQYEQCVDKCEARLSELNEQHLKSLEEDKEKKETKKKKEKKPIESKKKKEEIGVKRKASPTPPTETPSAKRERPKEDAESEDFGIIGDSSPEPDKTVFLSNLDFNTNEETIKNVMSTSGNVVSVRLVRNYNKKSKGFAYVVFSKHDEVEEALKRDRELVDGRPMFVSRYEADPSFKTPVFHFSQRLEKNKVFVKGLPKSKTKDDLIKLFEPFGILKDVRIVTFRSGQPKGIAYIEYEDPVAASQAVVKLDGIELDGLKISVAISNPPQRKEEVRSIEKAAPALGGGSRVTGPRGKGKSQIALVPASVQRKANAPAPTAQSSEAKPPAKSNEDFRKMLLGFK